jgi:hypothetical protein
MSGQINQLINQSHQPLAFEALIALAVIIFTAAYLRRVFAIIVLAGSLATILIGTAILSNDVGLSGPPGGAARLKRFLTVNQAATSEHGDGAAVCTDSDQFVARQSITAVRRAGHRTRHAIVRVKAENFRNDTAPAPSLARSESAAIANAYPELVRRAFPGLAPERLLQVAASTVSGLPGWQIVNTDPKTLTLRSIHKGHFLGLDDEIRIFVSARSEIDLCSRTLPDQSGSLLQVGIFHGDFGSNIGHIKEFYAALGPALDEAYRERELRLTAEEHGIRP